MQQEEAEHIEDLLREKKALAFCLWVYKSTQNETQKKLLMPKYFYESHRWHLLNRRVFQWKVAHIHHPGRCGCPKRTVPASVAMDKKAGENKNNTLNNAPKLGSDVDFPSLSFVSFHCNLIRLQT